MRGKVRQGDQAEQFVGSQNHLLAGRQRAVLSCVRKLRHPEARDGFSAFGTFRNQQLASWFIFNISLQRHECKIIRVQLSR